LGSKESHDPPVVEG